MATQTLISELTNLIQESKRKHTELRNVGIWVYEYMRLHYVYSWPPWQAAEKSLEELKALRSTSEAQIAAGKWGMFC